MIIDNKTYFSWYWYVLFHHFIHLCSGTEPKTQLLLRWCIAASFSTGALEVTGGATQGEVVEVRFIPKDGVTEDEMRRYLQDVLGQFGVDDHFKDIRTGKKGDFFAHFRQGSAARRLVQAMDFAQDVPWKHAMLWRQGKNHRPNWAARQCYMKDSMDFRLAGVILSHLSPCFIESNSFSCYVVEDFEVSKLCCGWIMWWTTFYLRSCLFGG